MQAYPRMGDAAAAQRYLANIKVFGHWETASLKSEGIVIV